MLFIVATPIGNLAELSPRALNTLNTVSLILAEDTRVFAKLKKHFNIVTPVISFHQHNEKSKIDFIKEKATKEDIALVSDAGMPLISDPGSYLIKSLLDAKIKVSVISGPCAAINCLVSSGLDCSRFYFNGFLSRGKEEKELLLLKAISSTLIFYEGKSRVQNTLKIMYQVFGDRLAAIGRELTKMHEEIITGSLSQLINKQINLKGEFVIVVAGAPQEKNDEDDKVFTLIKQLKKYGLSRKDVVNLITSVFDIKKQVVSDYYINGGS